jgi:hypothetical protein
MGWMLCADLLLCALHAAAAAAAAVLRCSCRPPAATLWSSSATTTQMLMSAGEQGDSMGFSHCQAYSGAGVAGVLVAAAHGLLGYSTTAGALPTAAPYCNKQAPHTQARHQHAQRGTMSGVCVLYKIAEPPRVAGQLAPLCCWCHARQCTTAAVHDCSCCKCCFISHFAAAVYTNDHVVCSFVAYAAVQTRWRLRCVSYPCAASC